MNSFLYFNLFEEDDDVGDLERNCGKIIVV